mgnify:CR=1 FL=1
MTVEDRDRNTVAGEAAMTELIAASAELTRRMEENGQLARTAAICLRNLANHRLTFAGRRRD